MADDAPPPHVTGVLLSNLGTPDEASPQAVRRYLREFLSDPRVVELPRWLWWPVLHGIVLRVRPRRSARAYRRIWTPEGSPLLCIARKQVAAVQACLNDLMDGEIAVALGMRYGRPSIAAALQALRDAGVTRLLVLPMYPQYASATTASTFDAVAAVLRTWRHLPELHLITHYHDEPWYVQAVAASIRDAWRHEPPAERLLFSFHGMPAQSRAAGDPYHEQCLTSARLIAGAVGLEASRWGVAFQSRFGPAEWLQPYTDRTLQEWAAAGVRSVDVVCPGFSADCLETLEEIAMLNRERFLEAGGERYRYIPALNDRPDHIRGLAEMISRHLT